MKKTADFCGSKKATNPDSYRDSFYFFTKIAVFE
jgi:hypothetical protein